MAHAESERMRRYRGKRYARSRAAGRIALSDLEGGATAMRLMSRA